MIRTNAFVLVVLLLVSSPELIAKEKDSGSDVERLQGTWSADLEPNLQARLTLDGSRLQYVHISGKRVRVIWDGHFSINEKAEPKQMDWTPLGKNGRDVPTSLAIYQLAGDSLLIIGDTEGPRPTAFYSGGGAQRPKTIVFRREKSAKSPKKRRAKDSSE